MASVQGDPTKPGLGVVLTEKMVLAKARAERLCDVKALNCWGQDLVDVTVLKQMPDVQVLSLSVNKIGSLRDFAFCAALQELYLRKNEIADLVELQWLVHLQNLHTLWLSDNPCAELPHYRAQVVSLLPGLKKLDNMDVTHEERSSRGLQLDRSPAGPLGAAASSQAPAAAPQSPAAGAGGPQQGTAGQTAAGSTPAPTEARAAMEVGGAGAVPPEVANGVQTRNAPGAPDTAAHVMQQAAALAAMAPAQQPAEAQQLVWEGPAAAALRPPLSRTPSGTEAKEHGAQQPVQPQGPAQDMRRQASRRASTRSKGSSNVLYAVMALLSELDDYSLRLVGAEVQQQLEQRKQAE